MRHYLFPISAVMVLAIATTISAQRPAATPTPSPAARPTTAPTAPADTTVALPTSKMAVIYTDLFLDQKTGIANPK